MTNTQDFTFEQKLRALEHAIHTIGSPQLSALGQLQEKAFGRETDSWLEEIKALARILLHTTSEI